MLTWHAWLPAQAWLDSDGQVGFNGPSTEGLADKNPLALLDAAAFLTDDQWHMLTVTTFSNGTKGYRQAPAAAHTPPPPPLIDVVTLPPLTIVWDTGCQALFTSK